MHVVSAMHVKTMMHVITHDAHVDCDAERRKYSQEELKEIKRQMKQTKERENEDDIRVKQMPREFQGRKRETVPRTGRSTQRRELTKSRTIFGLDGGNVTDVRLRKKTNSDIYKKIGSYINDTRGESTKKRRTRIKKRSEEVSSRRKFVGLQSLLGCLKSSPDLIALMEVNPKNSSNDR
ncbi:hypothetical protein HELRODRAFT_183691 [Helobdella robusta]|uniref:Uncharacterized protein n=1 Tax=Helobdella robusta TaxID=6412 RepID=T1FK18_HELRO|nr:hypothetical protein HELRODRAFT_183691 [Helobdella robusta]ESO10367.1 hypothetical protein HELRODRAFT_183691 [Helobdella robusta]